VQGRLRFEAKDVPVSVGRVVVQPGDVVVADGDGVIVVPRGMAREVARHARRELTLDMAARRRLYEQVGLKLDETVS
jgi:4-hydroxy-4-methyl-2-oxoglutarate aldolase